MCKHPGLVLVSGRGGSGVTSTLYSLLREHDSFTQQIVTFEKNQAIELENVTQNRYEADDGLAAALVSALRRDPDVLLVDTCPNAQSAEVVVEAAEKKSVILGISASETFVALAKWVKTWARRARHWRTFAASSARCSSASSAPTAAKNTGPTRKSSPKSTSPPTRLRLSTARRANPASTKKATRSSAPPARAPAITAAPASSNCWRLPTKSAFVADGSPLAHQGRLPKEQDALPPGTGAGQGDRRRDEHSGSHPGFTGSRQEVRNNIATEITEDTETEE